MICLQKRLFGRKIFDRRVYLFIVAIVLLFVFDGVAVYFSWYWTYQWLDIPVHLVAGLLLSLLFYYVAFLNPTTTQWLRLEKSKESVFTTMVFWVLVIALGWEIFEFVWGRTYISPKFGTDLFVDIVATCTGGLLGYVAVKKVNKYKT